MQFQSFVTFVVLACTVSAAVVPASLSMEMEMEKRSDARTTSPSSFFKSLLTYIDIGRTYIMPTEEDELKKRSDARTPLLYSFSQTLLTWIRSYLYHAYWGGWTEETFGCSYAIPSISKFLYLHCIGRTYIMPTEEDELKKRSDARTPSSFSPVYLLSFI